MDVNIFLLCFNESAILPHTIRHYKKYLPSCKITIYDNESEDNSVDIARGLGCNVVSWSSNNIHDENMQIDLRNNIWKTCNSGWVIMADMDEYLCVSEDDLCREKALGISILRVCGYDMVGESLTIDLSDINLQDIKKSKHNGYESKNLCFLRESIIDMNYGPGSHMCNPTGNIIYSSKVYTNKHMNFLGEKYLINKIVQRYKRSEKMRKQGWNTHYTNDVGKIKHQYYELLSNNQIME